MTTQPAECCPICLEDASDRRLAAAEEEEEEREHAAPSPAEPFLLCAPCGHAACRLCLEEMLLRNDADHNVVVRAHPVRVPTRGTCPLCRAPVGLFELTDPATGAPAYPTPWLEALPDALVGAVFLDPRGGRGTGRVHFERRRASDAGDSGAAAAPPAPAEAAPVAPMESFDEGDNEAAETARTSDSAMDAEEAFRDVVYFHMEQRFAQLPDPEPPVPLREAHFHAPSRTLAGVLEVGDERYQCWKVYLSFDRDYSFVRSGLLHKVRRRYEDPRLIRRHYPFDGAWRVEGMREPPRCVKGMKVTVQGAPYDDSLFLEVQRHDTQILLCDSQGEILATAAFDWARHPLGPDVGGSVVWSRRNQPWQTWTRLSVSVACPPDEHEYIGGASHRVLRRLRPRPTEPPWYGRNAVWGNVFCQGFLVGLASYHFASLPAEGVYISYEHPATAQWPPLDNGAPVPARVPFRHVQVDGNTFRGRILWQEDYGTTWQHMAVWNYEMVFDSEFTCIVSGRVLGLTRLADERPAWAVMSRYGESLVYVNAALHNAFRQRREEDAELFTEASRGLRDRLQQEGASVRTIAAVHRILTAAQSGGPDPIDHNG